MDELIVHVGPPKTATTEIQEALKSIRAELAELGVLLNLPVGLGNHARLAAHLRAMSPIIDERLAGSDGWFTSDPPTDVFPELAHGARQLITAESLASIGREGAQALVDWSGADRVHVVAGIREPTRWLWSTWQQECKVPASKPWWEFLDAHVATRRLDLTEVISPWTDLSVPVTVTFIEVDSPYTGGPVAEFLRVIGLAGRTSWDAGAPSESLNQSMGPIEAILTRALASEIAHDVEHRSWRAFGDIPRGFVGRVCYDILDKSRPMFELGRSIERGERPHGPQPLLDDLTSSRLAEFGQSWMEDAISVAGSPYISEDGYMAIENALTRYQSLEPFGGFETACGTGFPSAGGLVELPGEVIVFARVLATAIGMQFRSAIHNRQLWEQEDTGLGVVGAET